MKALRRSPLLKLVAGFILGIFAAEAGEKWLFCICMPAALYYFWIMWRHRGTASRTMESWTDFSMFLTICCAGMLYWNISFPLQSTCSLNAFEHCEVTIAGIVDSKVSENEYGKRLWLRSSLIRYEESVYKSNERLLLYIPKTQDQKIAEYDSLFVQAYVQKVRSKHPGYIRYLNRNQVFFQGKVHAMRLGESHRSLGYFAHSLQSTLSQRLESLIPDERIIGIAKAMYLGDKDLLSDETRNSFSAAGSSHILAISGLHVGVIYVLLNTLLSFLNIYPSGRNIKHICIIIVLIVYMLLTGASPAVIRASLMWIIVLVFKSFFSRYHMLNLVALAAFIQLLYDPSIVFSISFQLSYSAVGGILWLYPYFEKHTHTPWTWVNKLFACLGISLIATLCTCPLVIMYFGSFPTYFLLTNLLISLVAYATVCAGFFLILCTYFPILNEAIAFISSQLLFTMLHICEWVERLPYAVIHRFHIEEKGLYVLLVELCIVGVILYLPRVWFKIHASRYTGSQQFRISHTL